MKKTRARPAVRRAARPETARTILVPTDLSPIADDALEYALELGRRTGARLEVITVMGHVEGDVFNPIRYSPEASARGKSSVDLLGESLDNLLARHDTKGLRVSGSVRKGRPLNAILAAARRLKADMMVVGSHDRGMMHHFLVRSMTDELVRRAPCSVLVIHERETRPPIAVRRVLVPVDLSNVSGEILDVGAGLARLFDAKLDVQHVVETIPVLDSFSGAVTLRDMVPDLKQHSTRALEKVLEAADLGLESYGVFVDDGHAANTIVERARHEHADLVVIGKRGRSAIERFFIGSVTERVVRHAPCPVLVVDTNREPWPVHVHEDDVGNAGVRS